MPAPRPDLRLGRIVWAILTDFHGIRKRRPAVIVTATDDIEPSEPITVLAVSTTYADPPPDDHVELPWHPDKRRVGTGLARRSAVVINWFRQMEIDEIDELAGDVPPAIMIEILRRLPH
jgi:hypothetical protein